MTSVLILKSLNPGHSTEVTSQDDTIAVDPELEYDSFSYDELFNPDKTYFEDFESELRPLLYGGDLTEMASDDEIPYGDALLVDPENEVIRLTQSEISTLKQDPQNQLIQKIIYEQVNKIFQGRLNVTGLDNIRIDQGDIVFSGRFLGINLRDKCSLRVDAFDFKWEGTLMRSSNLSTGFSWQNWGVNVFLETHLDAGLQASSLVRGSVGVKFIKCVHGVLKKTVHVDLHAVGSASVKVNIT